MSRYGYSLPADQQLHNWMEFGEWAFSLATARQGTTSNPGINNPDPFFETFCLIFKNGASVTAFDGKGRTHLMWAAQLGQHKCIQWLIRNGSDTEAADDQGATSLCYAAKHGQLACLKVLLEARACIEGKSFCDTPLVLACKAGHLDCVKLLLEYGALIESDVFSYGFTPLMAAVKGGHQEIASLLVARGADPSIQSDYGFRAIDYAPIEMRDILLSEIERQQLSYILSQRRSESKMVETLGL